MQGVARERIAFVPETPFSLELKRWRTKDLRYTQEALADAVGTTRGNYKNYEIGQSRPPDGILANLRRLGFTPPNEQRQPVEVEAIPMVAVPVVGSVGAASPGDGPTNVDPDRRRVRVPEEMVVGKDALAWIVEGDSMMPDMPDGYQIVVRRHTAPLTGRAFLLMREGEHRVKVLVWYSGGWWQHSLNSQYEDEPLGNWQLLGYATGIYGEEDGEKRIRINRSGLRFR